MSESEEPGRMTCDSCRYEVGRLHMVVVAGDREGFCDFCFDAIGPQAFEQILGIEYAVESPAPREFDWDQPNT